MDKKTIKALSNFGDAIDTLVEQLKKQSEEKTEKTSIFSGLFGKNSITKQMKKIQEGIKSIKDDTKEIIKNQKEMLKVSKKNDKGKQGGVFEQSGEKGNMEKIKSGAGSILLIAASVLAIGVALKIVSPVDLVTVIALALAITAIGFAMAKLVDAGIPSPMESLSMGLAILSFTGGIVASSFLISLIPKISTTQFITFLGIGLTFGLMFKLGFGNMVKATKKMKLSSVVTLPLILVGISLAIMASSYILNKTQPIEYGKLLNILAMGITLGIIGLVMSGTLFLMGKLGGTLIKGALFSIIILPAISLAMMVSSHLLAMGDYSKQIPLGWVLSFSLAMLILAIPVAILGMIPLPLVIMGALSLIIIAGALVVASYLLSMISPDFMTNMADGIAYFVDVVGGAVIRFATKILPVLIKVATAFLTAIAPPLIAFIKAILPPLGEFITTIIDHVMPAVLSIIDVAKVIIAEISGIIDSLAGMLDSIGGIIDSIGNAFGMIGDKIIGILGGVKDIIATIANSVVKVIGSITDSIVSLSKIDGANLLAVGTGLGAIGAGLLVMTGGSIIKGISDFFTGDKLGDQLKSLSTYHEELYKTGKGIEMLSQGMSSLGDVDIDNDKLNQIVNVLERVNNMKASANIETVSKQVIDSGNLIQDLKDISKPDNEEMLAEMRMMNVQLGVLLSTNSSISAQLNSLGNDKEPSLDL